MGSSRDYRRGLPAGRRQLCPYRGTGRQLAPFLGGDNSYARVVNAVTLDFLRWSLRGDPAALTALRRDAVAPGIARIEDRLER